MEEHLNSLPVAHHLLQHTLRSLCIHENSQWIYAVFWRILPRNYPPPNWDLQGGSLFDRSRGNKRNWILVWEDGFCNFAASSVEINPGECASSSVCGQSEFQHLKGLQPELFFKMSHEIYYYGEGLIGKVAADRSHKWIYKEANEQAINFLSAWHNSGDSQPRTWEAQFQSGIQTIALIAAGEGVIQLGAVHKVMEDPSFVVLLRKKFSYLGSIPGVLLPHPPSSPFPFKIEGSNTIASNNINTWPNIQSNLCNSPTAQSLNLFNPIMNITPSMNSLEALLAKLPSVVPSTSPPTSFGYNHNNEYSSSSSRQYSSYHGPVEFMELQKMTKQEMHDDDCREEREAGESNNSMLYNHHQHLSLPRSRHGKGF